MFSLPAHVVLKAKREKVLLNPCDVEQDGDMLQQLGAAIPEDLVDRYRRDGIRIYDEEGQWWAEPISLSLYSISAKLASSHPNWFPKIEAHDQGDPDGRDLLWVSTEENEVSEGEVILLSPLSGGRWYAAHDYANKYGGWPTVWDFSGCEEDAISAIVSYLEIELSSIRAHK